MSAELQQKIISLYRDRALSAPAVATALESDGIPITDYSVYRCLEKNGVRRRRGRGHAPRVDALGTELVDLWHYGFLQEEIAQMYGTSRCTVNRRIREFREAYEAAGGTETIRRWRNGR